MDPDLSIERTEMEELGKKDGGGEPSGGEDGMDVEMVEPEDDPASELLLRGGKGGLASSFSGIPTQRVTSGLNYWLYDPNTQSWKYGATTSTAQKRCDQINSQCKTNYEVVVYVESDDIFATERFAHALFHAQNLAIPAVQCRGCHHIHRELFHLGTCSQATVLNATRYLHLAIAFGVQF
ncbi:hypothetical protein D9758_014616 [Tetrapyrgos nigripes]|uniref:Bacteriophage T5 Orf172 DNA-binding domain-containing protein n=1 Tax=Tetrapyrgos nigripes TaxID=182062 RepID=A0A8H5FUP3_9AGAR|nr:hypothetical protein D9758_014616 [Tetrapyrgos nigripes]